MSWSLVNRQVAVEAATGTGNSDGCFVTTGHLVVGDYVVIGIGDYTAGGGTGWFSDYGTGNQFHLFGPWGTGTGRASSNHVATGSSANIWGESITTADLTADGNGTLAKIGYRTNSQGSPMSMCMWTFRPSGTISYNATVAQGVFGQGNGATPQTSPVTGTTFNIGVVAANQVAVSFMYGWDGDHASTGLNDTITLTDNSGMSWQAASAAGTYAGFFGTTASDISVRAAQTYIIGDDETGLIDTWSFTSGRATYMWGIAALVQFTNTEPSAGGDAWGWTN